MSDLSVAVGVVGSGHPAGEGGRSPRPLLQLRQAASVRDLLRPLLPAERPVHQVAQSVALRQAHADAAQRRQQGQGFAQRRLLRPLAERTEPRLRLARARRLPDAHAVEGVSAELALQHRSHRRLLTHAHLQVHAVRRGQQLRLVGRPEVRERLHLPNAQLLQSRHLVERREADEDLSPIWDNKDTLV